MPRMQARRCQGCAAPLPDGPAGEAIRCPFCGLLHDASGGASRVQVHQAQLPRAFRMPGWVIGLIVVLVLATLIPMLLGVFVAWKAGSAAIDVAKGVVPVSSTSAARTTARLRDLPSGYHALDVAPPAGGYGAVDAVATLPWALAIAQAWQRDARLERIDVSRLRPDGTVNVQDDGEAVLTYRFASPGERKALREQARLSPTAEAVVGMWVQVRNGAPRVFGDAERGSGRGGEGTPPHPDAEPLARLMDRPDVRALHADLPFVNGYMIHLEDEGWVWYFSSLANESKPRVRARDGAVWPYRGQR